MILPESTLVEIVSDHDRVTISGPGQQDEGIELLSKVKGLYDAPVKTVYTSAAAQIGATYKGKTIDARLLTFAVALSRTRDASIGEVEARWRAMWEYGPDEWDPDGRLTRMEVTTETSGLRWIELALESSVDLELEYDPATEPTIQMPMSTIGPKPMWVSEPEMTWFETSASSGAGEIVASNPTDQVMDQTWKLTRGIWTIPDPSWTGPRRERAPGGKYPDRSITLRPVTAEHGTVEVTRDGERPMFLDAGRTNVTGQVGGGYFLMHSIPPHTPETRLPISVTGAPAGGARAELHQPRLWSRMQGGE
ncbi:hypothetical protein [Tomitella gaofuii]|uniref:hypothetical protein n=1 Tax=Tomitella gaofuii TaxID=2760083 RepID=UPI0015F9D715|nr:hypothetical protein [Tomitella gaofuii]